jgi:hypothetical protein
LLVVGVILSALGITPDNFFYQIRLLLQRIMTWASARSSLSLSIFARRDGCSAVWLIARLIKTMWRRNETP